ncbi:predicted protein [Naegleria gruberi]|uniref:Predicted protein n=1 Tax=Naegleria gruberi TaxID=5762 RepID=D2V983_NAEGR|nr:uncharacterized protein NAEGRDRAFT_47787 [Naegleria gruberi]EFC46666.1 predicted protein [Naegleria gruberi]|eukprot:XP_002679410.1 predicted protein [Naegleria gruberi strain NEG-M]
MCPNVLRPTWLRRTDSNNILLADADQDNTALSTPLLELDFVTYQKQIVEFVTSKNIGNKSKRARIKKKLCSLFSQEIHNSDINSSLDKLIEIMAEHSQVSPYIKQFANFLDGEIFDFDRNSVEFESIECKTDIWSEKYDSCIEITANTKYLLCMNCKLYDIQLHDVNFEFSSIVFKIDYCKQSDIVDFQVEMKGKIYYGADNECGVSAKAIWTCKKFVIFVNQTRVYNLSSDNPLKDFNDFMSNYYGKFRNSSLDLSKIEKYFGRKEKQDYSLKFNNYLQMEDNCLYHGTAQLDFRPGGFSIQLNHSTIQLQHIQYNYFTVKKKKPFVTVEIDNISYIDACQIIYSDEKNSATSLSLSEFISGYNCLANNLRGYLIYTKGSSAKLSYKGVGKCFGWCPPGLFTFKRNKEGAYKSIFKPSKNESGERKFPLMFGFGDFKFHRNQICSTETTHQLKHLLLNYFITNERKIPILNFDNMTNNGMSEYVVTPSHNKENQNGLFYGKITFNSNSRKLICDFMINGSLNIATIDFLDFGKIWMRPKCGSFDFFNRLYFMSANENCLSDIEIIVQ